MAKEITATGDEQDDGMEMDLTEKHEENLADHIVQPPQLIHRQILAIEDERNKRLHEKLLREERLENEKNAKLAQKKANEKEKAKQKRLRADADQADEVQGKHNYKFNPKRQRS